MGALLAELVAAQRSGAPAMTFSAPPLTPLLKRLKEPKLKHWGTVTLYDTWHHLADLAHLRFAGIILNYIPGSILNYLLCVILGAKLVLL